MFFENALFSRLVFPNIVPSIFIFCVRLQYNDGCIPVSRGRGSLTAADDGRDCVAPTVIL